MLAKDRKPTKLKALAVCEQTTHIVVQAVYSDMFPRKKIPTIGNRIIENSLTAYENIRNANIITVGHSMRKYNKRMEFEDSAVEATLNVCSDLKIAVPFLLENPDPNIQKKNQEWIENLQKISVENYLLANKWRESDAIRLYPNKKSKNTTKSNNIISPIVFLEQNESTNS